MTLWSCSDSRHRGRRVARSIAREVVRVAVVLARLDEPVLAAVARLVGDERGLVDGVVDDDLTSDAGSVGWRWNRPSWNWGFGRDRQPVDQRLERPGAVAPCGTRKPAANSARQRLVPLQRRLAAGDDDDARVVAVDLRSRATMSSASRVLGAVGAEVGVAPGARQVALRRTAGTRTPGWRGRPRPKAWAEYLLDDVRLGPGYAVR